MELLEKLESYEDKYNEIAERLSDREVATNPEKVREYGKLLAELEDIVALVREYKEARKNLRDAEDLLKGETDEEMQEFLREEMAKWRREMAALESKIKYLLVPRDPNDQKDIIVEIRAGAGGEEASLFAADLFRMYTKYVERQGWKSAVLSVSPSDRGGFKEIIFEVKGRGAYSKLKYESGVHRVQRIPITESGGRIHTSTATVAVLPVVEEVEVDLDPNDLRIDIFRSSGPGGQSVNTTDSAVRVTHLPTGIVVSCQEERSQLQNKDRALRILRARLYDLYQRQQHEEIASARRSQVGTGDRSEKIRTYNFPQDRVTDHRVGLTLHKLDSVLEGEIDDFVTNLAAAEQAEKIKQLGIR